MFSTCFTASNKNKSCRPNCRLSTVCVACRLVDFTSPNQEHQHVPYTEHSWRRGHAKEADRDTSCYFRRADNHILGNYPSPAQHTEQLSFLQPLQYTRSSKVAQEILSLMYRYTRIYMWPWNVVICKNFACDTHVECHCCLRAGFWHFRTPSMVCGFRQITPQHVGDAARNW